MLVILALLAGCGDAPDSVAGCPDAACRAAAVQAAWAEDRSAGTAALLEVPDVGEREALAVSLARAHPQDAGVLCPVLATAEARSWCEGLGTRPHLWTEAPRQDAPGGPGGPGGGSVGGGPGGSSGGSVGGGPGGSSGPGGPGGPSGSGGPSGPGNPGNPGGPVALGAHTVLPRADLLSALDHVEPSPSVCVDAAAVEACVEEQARRHAERGQATGALATCRALDDDRWRDECVFRAAEAVAGGRGDAAVDSYDLCLAAGSFRDRCFGHVARELAQVAPAADTTEAARWDRLAGRLVAVRDRWADLDPVYAAYAVDELWALSTARSVEQATELTGDMLVHLPQAAHPHARAALARAWTSRQAGGPQTLDGWRADFADTLAQRAAGASTGTTSRRRGRRLGPGDDLWDHDDPAAPPSQNYLGTSRRQVAADPDTDELIALLEALARGTPAQRRVVVEATGHAETEVGATAARLVEQAGIPVDDPRP